MSSEFQHPSAMFSGDNHLHVVFLPPFIPSHMTQLVQVARLFAARGVHSTIITTHHSALTFQPAVDHDIAAGHPLHIHTINFPSSEVGLPIGVENTGAATTTETTAAVFRAMSLLKTQIQQSILDLNPDFIFSDMFFPWTVDLEIPRLLFYPSCFFYHSVSHILKVDAPHDKLKSESESFVVPNLPDEITMKRSQVSEHYKTKTRYGELMEAVERSEKRSYGLVHNTFHEIEPAYVEHNKKFKGTNKIWPIGPLFHFFENDDKNRDVSEKKHSCLSWLDDREPESVIYACFGSMVRFPDAQITEIALALEESKQPFVWVVRKKEGEEAIGGMPEGFEERMKKENKGLILTGWAPQMEILRHTAVGGFLTHCGWHSVLEAVVVGVPMMTWPLYAEQFYNEKLVELLGIGVSVGADVWNATPVITSPIVGKESIIEAIGIIFERGSSVAESIRSKLKVVSVTAKRAVQPGGSSYDALTNLIEELKAVKLAPKSLP